jgi:hypothetical protein
MNQNKKDRLEAAGWRVGNAEGFFEHLGKRTDL